jgi:hypothetical protein
MMSTGWLDALAGMTIAITYTWSDVHMIAKLIDLTTINY